MKIEKVMIPKTRPSGTRDHTCMSRVLLPIATHIEFDYYIQVKGGGGLLRMERGVLRNSLLGYFYL